MTLDATQLAIKKLELSDRLTVRGLRIFLALEETHSIAKAAEKLGLSKSGISQHVTALEQNVGVTLFDRKQQPITLTPAGQVLGLHAHRIIAMVTEAEMALADYSAGSMPVFNFAIIDDLDASLTPVIATAMQSRLLHSHIRTFSGRSDEVTSRLVSREANIAVTASVPLDIGKFQIQALFREQFVLVVAKGKYSPDRDWRIQLAELPLIQYSENMPIGQLVITHLKRIRFDVPRGLSFETTRSVIATVAKTGGWTLATPLSILDAVRFREELDIFPLPFTGLSRDIFLINRMRELGPLPAELAENIQDLLRDDLIPALQKSAPGIAGKLQIISD